MTTAQDIIAEYSNMKEFRVNFETQWQEVAERVWPERSLFTTLERSEGEKRTEQMFDSTAMLALPKFAAAMDSLITPRTQQWHKLTVQDELLGSNLNVKRYLEAVNNQLWRLRYSPKANFAGQQSEVYMSIGAFGNGVMFVDDVVGVGIRYKSCHLGEIFYAENYFGKIDKLVRRFQMSARQIVQKYGDKASIKAKTIYDKNPEQRLWVLHCVKPNETAKRGDRSYRGMPYASYYVCEEGKEVMSEGGYRTFPYVIYRHITTPGETYGRGPAMSALPSIKMSNEMKKTQIRAGHLMTRPPLLLPADGALSAFSMRPDALNYGGLDHNGNELVKPLNIGARLDIGETLLEKERDDIKDAFLVNLFQILVEHPNMTATEAMIRAQEKGQLLAPTMGRHQSEGLGPQIERELDILSAAGVLPEMPEELIEAGGEVNIEYTAPINRLQRAEEGVAILRTLEQLAPLASLDPSIMDIFDPEKTGRELADINGVPAKVLRSKEELNAMEEQKQAQAEAAAMLQAAPIISSSVKDLSMASQAARQGGSVIPV
jgi:hypothetical protein